MRTALLPQQVRPRRGAPSEGGNGAFLQPTPMLEAGKGRHAGPRAYPIGAAIRGPVAQWIEHLIPNQGVAGSSPAGVAKPINQLR